jgi:hypothetical protein
MADPRDILDLGIDFDRISSYKDYEALWQRMAPVKAKMIEKNETCRPALKDTFIYREEGMTFCPHRPTHRPPR